MDSIAGIIYAAVIANWPWTLTRDTAGILLDIEPDAYLQEQIRKSIEMSGDRVVDLHLWRLVPGNLGVMLSVMTNAPQPPVFHRTKLSHFHFLSHLTGEVQRHTSRFNPKS